MPKQKRARRRPKKNWVEGKKKAMNERNLYEGQWEDRKQWSLGVVQRKKVLKPIYIYIYMCVCVCVCVCVLYYKQLQIEYEDYVNNCTRQ